MDKLLMDDIWEARDGKQMPISNLETNHILDCLTKIRREWPWRANYVSRLLLELAVRAAEK